MGLISYTNIEDDEPATGNLFNSRFAKIHDEINGNLTSANLANGAVTTAKIADGAVTTAKIDIQKYVDDNGWTVVNIGGHKTYTKEMVSPGGAAIPQGWRTELGNTEPPVGRTRDNIAIVTTWYGGYSGHVILGCEATSGTKFTVQIAHNYIAPLVMNGKATLIATDKI
jgi:hypothetical protein